MNPQNASELGLNWYWFLISNIQRAEYVSRCGLFPWMLVTDVILFCNWSNFGILDYHLHGVERNSVLAGFLKVAV